jgi:hypothetical protein
MISLCCFGLILVISSPEWGWIEPFIFYFFSFRGRLIDNMTFHTPFFVTHLFFFWLRSIGKRPAIDVSAAKFAMAVGRPPCSPMISASNPMLSWSGRVDF